MHIRLTYFCCSSSSVRCRVRVFVTVVVCLPRQSVSYRICIYAHESEAVSSLLDCWHRPVIISLSTSFLQACTCKDVTASSSSHKSWRRRRCYFNGGISLPCNHVRLGATSIIAHPAGGLDRTQAPSWRPRDQRAL